MKMSEIIIFQMHVYGSLFLMSVINLCSSEANLQWGKAMWCWQIMLKECDHLKIVFVLYLGENEWFNKLTICIHSHFYALFGWVGAGNNQDYSYHLVVSEA